MRDVTLFRTARKSTLRRGLSGLVVAVFIGIIGILVLDVRDQLTKLSTANSDNVQWGLSQTETEIMALDIATREAAQTENAPLSDVRIRFDIFYSRLDTLKTSPLYANLQSGEDFGEELAKLLAFRDAWVPFIDASDDILRPELDRLAKEAGEARQAARAMALDGINVFSKQRDIRRESVSDTLARIALLTIGLVLVLLVLVSAMNRLAQIRSREARENRIIRERVETIISTSLDAVIVTNRVGTIIEYNGAAERVFGHKRDVAIGADMADLIMPDHMRVAHDNGMKRYNETGETRVIEKGIVQLEAKRHNGEVFPIDLSLARADSNEGEIFIAFIRDISDRVRAETELRMARDRAIAGEKSKAELLAVMSHEMRTPLNGMLGTLDLVDTEALDSRHRRYIRIIRNSGNVLLGHVNDVLDISRLDSGKFSLAKTRFDLIKLLGEIVETLSSRALENGNKIILRPAHPDYHEVYSDPDRLRQILLNLAGNAIKFTRNGQVIIEVDGSEGMDKTEIRVIDNGTGISEEDLNRIFDDFVTVDASYKRNNSGTGLGLGISRRLATALGGDLGAESELGDGSVFYVRLPLNVPAREMTAPAETFLPPKPSAQPDPGKIPSLNVLIVEDNAINRMILREMLERDGHKVHEAHDGEEGAAMAIRHDFDIILMDISMPVVDGVTAAKRIRASGVPGCEDIPIIATTAHALPDEVKSFHAAGMNDVLIKPLSMDALRRMLSKTLALNLPEQEAPEDEGDDSSDLVKTEVLSQLVRDLPEDRLKSAMRTLYAEVDAFLDSMPDHYGSSETRKAMSAEAHRLAGSTGVFGLIGMTDLMRLVQQQAPDADAEDLDDMHEALVVTWQDSRAELKRNKVIPSPIDL